MLTTNLKLILDFFPCSKGWSRLIAHLGKDFPVEEEINLLTILESNGVPDALWALRATVQDSRNVSSRLAIIFAEEVLPVFEGMRPDDKRPRLAIQAANDYLAGKITGYYLDAASSAAEASAEAVYKLAPHGNSAAHAANAASSAASAAYASSKASASAFAGYAAAYAVNTVNAVYAAKVGYAAAEDAYEGYPAASSEATEEMIRKQRESIRKFLVF